MRSPTNCVLQVMSMRGPGDEDKAADAARKPGDQPLRAGTSFCAPTLDCSTPLSRPVSPLTSLLTCREVAPRILEHEKALLVIKEHDYAKIPDRPELLQLASLCMSEEGNFALLESSGDNSLPLNGSSDSTRTRKAMKDLLLNCHSDVIRHRESLLSSKQDENSLSSHFRDVVSLQVALIREQQEQLYEKDKELSTVRKEKEQLVARLERMERRLSIMQKHSKDKQLTDAADVPNSLLSATRARLSRAGSITASEQRSQSRSSSIDRAKSRSRPSSHSGTPVPPEDKDTGASSVVPAKRSHKRRLKLDLDSTQEATSSKKAKKKTLERTEVRTAMEYCGLDLPHDMDVRDSVDSVGVLCNHSEGLAGKNDFLITVPSWNLTSTPTTKPSPSTDCCLECEDTSDEGFLKRHKKPEEDEKRRKRWDLQRARAIREHEELLRKYKLKGGGGGGGGGGAPPAQGKEKKKEQKVVSFSSKLEDLEAIEVMDTIAVSAFGKPLPLIKPSEFELPWFDLDAREEKESVRTTRSKARTTRHSVGSSGTEES